jgi:hypothetical protein
MRRWMTPGDGEPRVTTIEWTSFEFDKTTDLDAFSLAALERCGNSRLIDRVDNKVRQLPNSESVKEKKFDSIVSEVAEFRERAPKVPAPAPEPRRFGFVEILIANAVLLLFAVAVQSFLRFRRRKRASTASST